MVFALSVAFAFSVVFALSGAFAFPVGSLEFEDYDELEAPADYPFDSVAFDEDSVVGDYLVDPDVEFPAPA